MRDRELRTYEGSGSKWREAYIRTEEEFVLTSTEDKNDAKGSPQSARNGSRQTRRGMLSACRSHSHIRTGGTMIHGDYKYYCKRDYKAADGKVTFYFKCSKHGPPVNCPARLTVYTKPGDSDFLEQTVVTSAHTCKEYAAAQNRAIGRIDCLDEQKVMLEERALTDLRRHGRHIHEEVQAFLVEKYGKRVLLDIRNKDQSTRIVDRARLSITGGDVFRTIEGVPERHVSETDSRDFLQFNVSYTQGGTLHRITGFAHPELMRLLRYSNTTLFIDGTFKVTPKPFVQCLIVMVYDRATSLYLPVYYILTTARDEWGYWHALHWLQVGSGMDIEAATVSCDFEWPIIEGVQDQFPNAHLVGCLFHWKQALRRKMLNQRIPGDQIRTAMQPGVMDLPTVVSKSKLKAAITHVKTLIPTTGAAANWRSFWTYFEKTWVKKYPFETWNVSGMRGGSGQQNQ